jgi:hypothetical protein
MLVFGDPQFEETLSTLIAKLRQRVLSTERNSLDALRILLVQAGQLEQALGDFISNLARSGVREIEAENFSRRITDEIAKIFCEHFNGNSSDAAHSLAALRNEICHFTFQNDFVLTVKIPEGFAFYALFPEQYILSAANWMKKNSAAKKMLVVGLRSIGTSLSAVVSETLRASGLETIRVTVRPRGNPFERTVSFAENFPGEFRHALVVDEGPGISGSSMVAAAEALVAQGIPRENISFFPGNENPPGSEASAKIRDWWNSTPRYFTSLNQMCWNGKSLEQILLEKSNDLLPRENRFDEIRDVTNGVWRNLAYASESDWPAVNIPFERAKFLCSNGSEKILWKFTGLVSDEKPLLVSDEILVPEQLGTFQGFTATRWIDGARLTRRDKSPRLLKSIANHLLRVAGNELSSADIDSGIERLTKMFRRNCELVFGAEALCEIDILAKHAREFFSAIPHGIFFRSYGDGRVAPQEWIRTGSSEIFKTDIGGHDADHTIVGKQSLLWDIAGVIVEWNLDAHLTATFLESFQTTEKMDRNALTFFELSYAAFRMGQSFLCAEMNSQDFSERERLLNAAEFYKARISIHQFIQSANLRAEIVQR